MVGACSLEAELDDEAESETTLVAVDELEDSDEEAALEVVLPADSDDTDELICPIGAHPAKARAAMAANRHFLFFIFCFFPPFRIFVQLYKKELKFYRKRFHKIMIFFSLQVLILCTDMGGSAVKYPFVAPSLVWSEAAGDPRQEEK